MTSHKKESDQMKLSKQKILEYWRNHVEQSKQYKDGIQAYCKDNKLTVSTYYRWSNKFLDSNSKNKISKKVKSVFLPMTVSAPELPHQSYPQKNKNLPDSHWVAEIITNVIRGLL